MIAGKRDAIPFRLGDAKCQETVRLADKLSVGTVEVAGFAGVQVFRKKLPNTLMGPAISPGFDPVSVQLGGDLPGTHPAPAHKLHALDQAN